MRVCLRPPIRWQQEAATTAGSSRVFPFVSVDGETLRVLRTHESKTLHLLLEKGGLKDFPIRRRSLNSRTGVSLRCSPGCRTPSGGSASTRSTGCPGGSGPGGPEPRPPAAPARTLAATSWKNVQPLLELLLWSHDHQPARSHFCKPWFSRRLSVIKVKPGALMKLCCA